MSPARKFCADLGQVILGLSCFRQPTHCHAILMVGNSNTVGEHAVLSLVLDISSEMDGSNLSSLYKCFGGSAQSSFSYESSQGKQTNSKEPTKRNGKGLGLSPPPAAAAVVGLVPLARNTLIVITPLRKGIIRQWLLIRSKST